MASLSELVKELRGKDRGRYLDCQKALTEPTEKTDSIDKRSTTFDEGLGGSAEKAGRETNQGLIHAYIHAGGKSACSSK